MLVAFLGLDIDQGTQSDIVVLALAAWKLLNDGIAIYGRITATQELTAGGKMKAPSNKIPLLLLLLIPLVVACSATPPRSLVLPPDTAPARFYDALGEYTKLGGYTVPLALDENVDQSTKDTIARLQGHARAAIDLGEEALLIGNDRVLREQTTIIRNQTNLIRVVIRETRE